MEAYSWFEEIRAEMYTPEEREAKIAELRQVHNSLDKDVEPNCNQEEDMMHEYTHLGMEAELFDMGQMLIDRYSGPEEEWRLGEYVYQYYACYYMLQKSYNEAEHWYLKTLEVDITNSYSVWPDLAACYVEMGNHEMAEHWIEKYAAFHHENHERHAMEYIDFATYYLSIHKPEKALELLLLVKKTAKFLGPDFRLLLGRAYLGVGDMLRGISTLKEQVELFPDFEAFGHLGSAIYNFDRDNALIAEEYFLKSLELTDDHPILLDWKISIHENLSILWANECDWEKAYRHLFEKYLLKYPGEQSVPFKQVFGNLPPTDNDDMARQLFECLVDFEHHELLPHNRKPTDNVADLPKGGFKLELGNGFDLGFLTNLDESQQN